MCDTSCERIGQGMFNESFFNMRAFAVVEHCIAHAASEYPVQWGDMRRLERIEVAADDSRTRRITFGHRRLEFFEAPCGVGEDEMEIKNADSVRHVRDADIGEDRSAIAYLGEESGRHELYEQARSER